jgi:hypothetical protein
MKFNFVFVFLFIYSVLFGQSNTLLPDSIALLLDDCPFQIEQIISSKYKNAIAVSGLRNCKNVVFREVTVYKKGGSLNSKLCNTFLTTNTEPVKMKWQNGILYIYQHQYQKAILKETTVMDDIQVIYPDDEKSFY